MEEPVTWEDLPQFMDEVRKGDLLFHGDDATQQQLGVKLTTTGMACAMCHPMASDTHPHEFPKFQAQIGNFATLREMINWCIEKPNQGVVLDHSTIYDRIWHYDFGPDSKNLAVYIGYLRRKTEAEGEPRLIQTVRGVGYSARESA